MIKGIPPQSADAAFSALAENDDSDVERAVLSFVQSAHFDRLFRDGMALVEQTAGYLDGPGRVDSRDLPRASALAYAGESMRLTTRLMQVASWLLVHRSIQEGELKPKEARRHKYRLGAKEVCRARAIGTAADLPSRLLGLLGASEQLYERVSRLDNSLYQEPPKDAEVTEHLNRLQQEFGPFEEERNLVEV